MRRGAVAIALGLCLLGADAPGTPPRQHGDVYSFDSVVSHKTIPNDPGPAPAFNVDDYAPYKESGNGSLAGEPVVKTSDGQSFSCLGETVYLYPNTEYVRWMLYKYVHYVYTTDHDSVDPAALVAAPWILHWYWYSKTSVVRQAECAEATNGQFRFTGLPAGDYIALVNVRVPVTTSSVAIDEQLGMTPSGEVAPVYTDRVIHGAGLADGWIVIGGNYNIPSDGLVHVALDSSWVTAAHLSGGNRIDPHMKIQK